MHYFKQILLISLIGLCTGTAAAQDALSACLEQGKKEFAARDYSHAQLTFQRCLSLDKTNVDVLLSLGGVSLTQNDLQSAKNYFLAALKHMEKNSPYWSYTYSMLGDISLKQQRNRDAMGYYNQSLAYNKANVNSLVGKGVITEAQGDQKTAAKIYQTALAVEPLNLIARKRLISLEPVYFSDEEILEALKQRYAVLPDKETLSEADRDLFGKIHSAEQRGGIDYLKGRYPVMPPDYIATLFKDTSFAREVLTLSGYNAMQKQIGQDALAVFQKAGVRTQDIFDLRDLKGNKIFLPDSTLNERGMYVYNEALQGRKAYLLPSEAVPPTQAYLDKVAAQVNKLEENGYKEISRAELAMIKKQTNCSDETLRKHMGLYVLPVTKNNLRYFVIARAVSDQRKGVPWYYVALARSRTNPAVTVPHNSLAEMYSSWNYKLCSSVDGELLK